jgi:hypothetical protein
MNSLPNTPNNTPNTRSNSVIAPKKNQPESLLKINITKFYQSLNDQIAHHELTSNHFLDIKEYEAAAKYFERTAILYFETAKELKSVEYYEKSGDTIIDNMDYIKKSANQITNRKIVKLHLYAISVYTEAFETYLNKFNNRLNALSEKLLPLDETYLESLYEKVTDTALLAVTNLDVSDKKYHQDEIIKIAKLFTFIGFLTGESQRYNWSSSLYHFAYELYDLIGDSKLAEIAYQNHSDQAKKIPVTI